MLPPHRLSALSRYYVKSLRSRSHRAAQLSALLASSTLHATGHALVALVGSALALALGARWGRAATEIPSIISGCSLGRTSSPLCSLVGAGPGAIAKLADQQAFFLSVVGLLVLVVKGASGVCATYIQARIAGQVGCGLRLELFDALLDLHRLRQPRHADHREDVVPTARAVLGLTDRVREVEAGLAHGLLGGGRSIAQLLPLAALLAALSLRAAGIAACTLAFFGFLLGRWRSGYRRATGRAARQHERLVETADDSVRHADLWVSYGAEANARTNVGRLGDAVADGRARLDARAAALSGANEVLGAAALVLAIGAAGAGWLGSIGDGATLLAFAVTFFLAYRPLRELADATAVFSRAQVAYAELSRVIERAALRESARAPGANASMGRVWPLAPLELGALRLARGVGSPISLRVAGGAIAVITGPTGAGKTTLLRTLLGLESALGGDVIYGGVSLRDSPAGPSARPFAWVPQDAPLLADTLAANIALGESGVDARAALDPLGAAHLVQELDTSRLGQSGRNVSGGERQWIALARAIATRQPVLLLDEPTSGLDPRAQRMVLDAVEHLRGRRTVILVTHRSEPLAIADVVLRIDALGATEHAA
jgi:ABC-type multidrug transport system fused ATPase/permease subunit